MPDSAHAQGSEVAATSPAAPLPQLVGFEIQLRHVDEPATVFAELDRVAELGCNAVQIVTPIFQPHAGSTAPRIDQRPERGPSDDALAAVITHARRLGMNAILTPRLELTRPRGPEGRGQLNPGDWAVWWLNYRAALLNFAALAEDANATVFVVGCDLPTTLSPAHETYWRDLIADVRDIFPGHLTYATSWAARDRVAFWDTLDLVTLHENWDTTSHARKPDQPKPRERDKAWKTIRKDLTAYTEQLDLPLLLTGVGYASSPPSTPAGQLADAPAVPAVQSQGYRAFLRAWAELIPPPPGAGDPSPYAGVMFHEWSVYDRGGPFDPGYTVQGKPAEAVLRRFFAGELD